MPLAKWALWRLGCQLAPWQRTGLLSKDSGELCKIRNPRPHKGPADRPQYCNPGLAPKIVMAGALARPLHRNTSEIQPVRYFHSTFITS